MKNKWLENLQNEFHQKTVGAFQEKMNEMYEKIGVESPNKELMPSNENINKYKPHEIYIIGAGLSKEILLPSIKEANSYLEILGLENNIKFVFKPETTFTTYNDYVIAVGKNDIDYASYLLNYHEKIGENDQIYLMYQDVINGYLLDPSNPERTTAGKIARVNYNSVISERSDAIFLGKNKLRALSIIYLHVVWHWTNDVTSYHSDDTAVVIGSDGSTFASMSNGLFNSSFFYNILSLNHEANKDFVRNVKQEKYFPLRFSFFSND